MSLKKKKKIRWFKKQLTATEKRTVLMASYLKLNVILSTSELHRRNETATACGLFQIDFGRFGESVWSDAVYLLNINNVAVIYRWVAYNR